MSVGDRDTSGDVFCQDCGRIADKDTLNSLGLCEDCASPLANIVETTESTRQWLQSIITPQPKGRAEYTTRPTKNFPDRIYDTLIDRLDELKAQGIVGYRESENSIAIVLHKRS